MKLTKREVFLLRILFLVILWTLFLKMRIIPDSRRLLENRRLFEECRLLNEKHFKQEEMKLDAEKFFYYDMETAQIDSSLQQAARNSGVEILSMKIGAPAQYEPAEGSLPVMEADVMLEFQCNDICCAAGFSQALQEGSRSRFIKSLELEHDRNAGKNEAAQYVGKMEVSYYYVETASGNRGLYAD